MTARRSPSNRQACPAVKLSGEMAEVPSETLANESAAAESTAQDVEAPGDEVADDIAELEAEANCQAVGNPGQTSQPRPPNAA